MDIISNPTTPIKDDDIPDWLLFEILLRLPLKSVFTCRIVSKRWLSVSSEPSFIRAYASRASSEPHWIALSPLLMFPDETVRPTLEHNPSNNLTLLELHLPPHGPGDIEVEYCSVVAASDDGLMLYCSTTPISVIQLTDFYVFNPITGHRIRPLLCVESQQLRPSWGFLTRVDPRDFTLRSYRIVHAEQHRNKPNSLMFNVYYSEIGARKRFLVPFCSEVGANQLWLQESAAAVDGTLYWAETRGRGVIAYEPETKPEQVRVIRDPDGVEKPYHCYYSSLCVACRGELRYFGGYCVNEEERLRFDIWRLEGEEWSLVHKIDNSVDSGGMIGPKVELRIMCFDPLDSDKVCLVNGYGESARALAYDMTSGAFEDRSEMTVKEGFCCGRFPETVVLVVPPWPVRVSEKHLEMRLS